MQLATLKHRLFSFVLVLLGATPSFACMCGDTGPTVTEARDTALMVFSGKVVDAEYRNGAFFPDGKPAGSELTVHFKIDRWWKGEPLSDIFLFTEQYQAADYSSIATTDCAYTFDVGKRYLVYATDLQRDQLEQDMLGKAIIWTGRIRSIESGKDGGVRVIVEPSDGKSGSAFLDFDSSQKANFLSLKEKQVIRFTGVIRSYVASPFLEKCKLLRVVE